MKRGPDFRVEALFFTYLLMTIHTFANGLRAVVDKIEGNVSYIGVLTKAGSRNDPAGLDGLAHFVEHTIFKGTPKRSSLQVSNRMELIGGYLNAYTSKEQIMLYTGAPAGFEERSVELISDLIENAHFPAEEIERERGVIVEEIHSYDESPSDAVFDDFDELFFSGSSLAHNILGYTDSVDRINGTDARRFLTDSFTPANMVFYCASPMDEARVLRLVEKHMGNLHRETYLYDPELPVGWNSFDETRTSGKRQANTVLGAHIFDVYDERQFSMLLFSNILGGPSMNSRLNRELREKCGLVYAVDSSATLLSDTGMFQIYFATEPANVDKCRNLVRREIETLAAKPLTDRNFTKARRQICGQLLMRSENRKANAMMMAQSVMRYGRVYDKKYIADRVADLTPTDLLEFARYIADLPMSHLTLA